MTKRTWNWFPCASMCVGRREVDFGDLLVSLHTYCGDRERNTNYNTEHQSRNLKDKRC